MATKNVFDTISVNSRDQQRSFRWYRDQINNLTKKGQTSESSIMRGSALTTSLIPGNMYLFYYDPKHKDTLPYYDRLPLVLPFNKTDDGFYGLNLHYIPYMLRFKILGALSEYATDEKISERTRIEISWKIVDGSSKLEPLKACVKRYLTNHIRSKFLKINYSDWLTASQLPLERFEKANKQKVWYDSRQKYG